jgi:uncharacterized LabA/DUF88 family protein
MNRKKLKNYAFIDGNNLHLGTTKDVYRKRKKIYRGWEIDFSKFRQYLTDKFRVSKAFYYIGYREEQQELYKELKQYGFNLIHKPTLEDVHGNVKGNVDAELVLGAAAIQIDNYDKAVIASGDGDFHCLYDYLQQKGKLGNIIIPNAKSESSLLKPYQKYKVFLQYSKKKLKKER